MSTITSMKKRSHTVRNGFFRGFKAPFLVFYGGSGYFSYRRNDTVEDAWKEVGEELADATRTEGKRIGKTSKPEEPKLVHN